MFVSLKDIFEISPMFDDFLNLLGVEKRQLAQIWFLFLVETDQKQNSIGRVYVIRRFRFSDSSYRNCQFMHFVYQVHTQLYIQT